MNRIHPDRVTACSNSRNTATLGSSAWNSGEFFSRFPFVTTFHVNSSTGEDAVELEMKEILKTMPQTGFVQWIGLRPGRRQPITVVEQAAIGDQGLAGDRFEGASDAPRMVTLIQKEHIDAIASILGRDSIDPSLLRRNIVVSGINLLALKEHTFQIGDAKLFGTGNCAPCSRMEENLGPGGYNAMRGHGGITARVINGGIVRLGDRISFVD
jgi:MOSC domain-containing protein YiiM